MRILQLIDKLSPGGAERMAINIANVLHEKKNDSYLCSTRGDGGLRNSILPDVELLLLNKKSILDFRELIRLVKFIYSKDIEIIHAHSSSIFWGVFIKIFKPSIKVIWHDHFGNRENVWKRNVFYVLISVFCYRVIVVNTKLEKWARKFLLIANNKIIYLKNFPYLNLNYKPQSISDSIQIIYLANLKAPKNHHLLVESIYKLKSREGGVNINVVLVGAYQNDNYYKSLISLITKYNLISVFKFIGSVSDPSEYLLQANIGVICSSYEGLPVSLLEYGLVGLPVVSTSIGQCSEVLDFGKAGWLVESGNCNAFSNALFQIVSNRLEANEKGLILKERVLNNYGSHSFLEGYLKHIV